jgi:dTDP-4-dehydrorhamnose reductase
MRIAVVGAGGQLGAAIAEECATAHDTVTFTRANLDATDDAAVAAAMDRARPDAIVNGSAYTDVDGAEDHPVVALNVNAFAVRALARAAEAHGAALVHFSTDFVFDGTASAPYTEQDRPNPRSVYAASKLLGEWLALEAPRAYVLRVESLFGRAANGPAAKGSVAGIVRTLLGGGSPKVFEDRTVSPSYIPDAARATRRLLESAAPPGLYHCVNSGLCTWLEFAQELARQLGVEPRFDPVKMADVALRAARPKYCALSNEKLRSTGIEMPSWQDALARYVATIGSPSSSRG